MSFLNPTDRKNLGFTCRRLYAASYSTNFNDNTKVVFFRTRILEDDQSPVKELQISNRPFLNFHFEELELNNKLQNFWQHFGPKMQSLCFKECDMSEKTFTQALKWCGSLHQLEVISCREMLMSGRLLETQADIDLLRDKLGTVKTLNLASNRYLSDALFHRFAAIAPNFCNLVLRECLISFHKGLYKKFYPGNGLTGLSESVLTFHYILDIIKKRAKSLKMLNFGFTLFDGSALTTLSEVEGLQLQILRLESCDQLTNVGILSLVSTQKHLTELNLNYTARLTDQSVIAICNGLEKLEKLYIRRCRGVTNQGVVHMRKLKHLKVLDISECSPFLTDDGVKEGICSTLNSNFTALYLKSLDIVEISVIAMVENLPNLTILDLSFCIYAVTDKTIQLIFQYLVWLTVLKLDHCDQVSDAGITGMGMGVKAGVSEVTPNVTKQIKVVDEDTNNVHRISLRSKAEEEIVKDAKRKKVVLQLCEENIFSDENSSGFSIARLKGLQTLNLSGCKITDVSLKYSFRFKELRKISLSHCHQVSMAGIKHLVAGCPAIEKFNLGQCHNITDEAVLCICKGLPRLKYLYLNCCNKITNHSLDAINMYCKNLKVLDISGCRSCDADTSLKMCNSGKPVRTVIMSKPGPYMTSNHPIPPPLPPSYF